MSRLDDEVLDYRPLERDQRLIEMWEGLLRSDAAMEASWRTLAVAAIREALSHPGVPVTFGVGLKWHVWSWLQTLLEATDLGLFATLERPGYLRFDAPGEGPRVYLWNRLCEQVLGPVDSIVLEPRTVNLSDDDADPLGLKGALDVWRKVEASERLREEGRAVDPSPLQDEGPAVSDDELEGVTEALDVVRRAQELESGSCASTARTREALMLLSRTIGVPSETVRQALNLTPEEVGAYQRELVAAERRRGECGPADEPRRINSYEEMVSVFGNLGAGLRERTERIAELKGYDERAERLKDEPQGFEIGEVFEVCKKIRKVGARIPAAPPAWDPPRAARNAQTALNDERALPGVLLQLLGSAVAEVIRGGSARPLNEMMAEIGKSFVWAGVSEARQGLRACAKVLDTALAEACREDTIDLVGVLGYTPHTDARVTVRVLGDVGELPQSGEPRLQNDMDALFSYFEQHSTAKGFGELKEGPGRRERDKDDG